MIGGCAAILIILGSSSAHQRESLWAHFEERSDLIPGPDARVLLLVVDATGDGRPEIFLANAGKCGNGGCGWLVYSPTGAAGRVRYLGEAEFALGGYRLEHGVLSLCLHMSAAECGWGQYRFRAGRMEQLPGRICEWPSPDSSWCDREIEAIRAWQAHAPKVLFASVRRFGLDLLVWKTASGDLAEPTGVPELNRLVVETASK